MKLEDTKMKLGDMKKMLLGLSSPKRLWVKEFLLILEEKNLVSDETIGRFDSGELLGTSKIHRYTTSKSGRFVTGFDELIECLEKTPSDETIFNTSIRGEKKFGVLYFKENREVIGGVVVENSPPRPKKLPSWMSSGENDE
jgi:hypothetical protein